MNTITLLCLGDSYTVGEGVELVKSFPYQMVQMLRKKGYNFNAPEIIAKTGWTTDELDTAIKGYTCLQKYDFVTLLIGVNNQYRGRDIIEYKDQMEGLIKKAISLANGKAERVYILSIPDYSVTPHSKNMDRGKIAKDIEVFNSVSKALSIQYKTRYLDITESSKNAAQNPALVTEDGLHPSALEYAKWAEKLAELIVVQLK
jgi:lysophospholipase L1-like esterase